eukprot:1161799-Pelagomonas_calceolata.AAC.6
MRRPALCCPHVTMRIRTTGGHALTHSSVLVLRLTLLCLCCDSRVLLTAAIGRVVCEQCVLSFCRPAILSSCLPASMHNAIQANTSTIGSRAATQRRADATDP